MAALRCIVCATARRLRADWWTASMDSFHRCPTCVGIPCDARQAETCPDRDIASDSRRIWFQPLPGALAAIKPAPAKPGVGRRYFLPATTLSTGSGQAHPGCGTPDRCPENSATGSLRQISTFPGAVQRTTQTFLPRQRLNRDVKTAALHAMLKLRVRPFQETCSHGSR